MIKNQIKTFVLLVVLTVILLVVGWLVGGTMGLTIALVIALVTNLFTYYYSDRFVLSIYKAKQADPVRYSRLHELVKEVATNASLPKPKVYIVPSQNPNAFATGRNPKNSSIAITQGILNLLDENEIKGVLAHELAHIRNRDILISSITAVFVGAISYLAILTRFNAIFGGEGERGNIFELLALAIVAPLAATMVRLAISRSREFLADEIGARIIKNPFSLADALVKIESGAKSSPMKFGAQTTSHIFIVNPFSAERLSGLFSTHPSTLERVGRLRSMHL